MPACGRVREPRYGPGAMMVQRRVLGWFPPFLVGASAAVTAEVSAGLLLYSEAGFLPALTLILTVESAAAALGLWSGIFPILDGAVEQLRQRWFFALVVFAIAAVLSGGRTLWEESANGALAQGLALAFLGCLPLFALGSILGAMSAREGAEDPPAAEVGVPAVLGLAFGFLLTGSVLVPQVAPYSIYLLCLIALSGSALLQGRLLDRRTAVVVRDERMTPLGQLRVEDRVLGSPRVEARILMEEGRVRGAEDGEGRPVRAWERWILAALVSRGESPNPTLYLGGGSGTLARALSEAYPGIRITLTERNPELLEMASRYLSGVGEDTGARCLVGSPFSILASLEEEQALVLLDAEAIPSLAGLPFLRTEDWRLLREKTGPGGLVVLGGLCGPHASEEGALAHLAQEGRHFFPAIGILEGEPEDPGSALLPGAFNGPGTCLVLGEPTALEWATQLAGFRLMEKAEG
ncbi:hypothetical protein ACFL3S_03985 [Gemmatimonadota bacterium]